MGIGGGGQAAIRQFAFGEPDVPVGRLAARGGNGFYLLLGRNWRHRYHSDHCNSTAGLGQFWCEL
jgi:hypothetical protein